MNSNDLLKINRDLTLLAPGFASRVEQALDECHRAGYPVFVFEGWRSPERQAALVQQNKPDRTVTNATPGFSFHQYGLAVDLAYGGPGKWHWQGDFDKPGAIFKSHGFDPPPSFEKGHMQISNGFTINQIRKIIFTSTLQGLWLLMGLT